MECVPNISEGRDDSVVERIAEAGAGAGCRILDIHSDPDHDRSVVTMVGDRTAILNGAVALAERATALIDLREGWGVHPCIGAVDVIPFVPLTGIAMSDCANVARNAGRAIAERLALPVYLYGAAQASGREITLPRIRRRRFAELTITLREIPPDYGPRKAHPTAGAVAVGAREPLVAYNVVLACSDVRVARSIARVLRESNGGPPGVKALGLKLHSRSLVQVSMNLTDITATTVPQAFEAVLREASARGVAVLESEIVGLLPRAALAGATATGLRMATDPRAKILEDVIERSLR